MKKLLLCGLLMWLSANTLWAECPPNSITLKSSKRGSKRDWVQDFDKLEKKYSKTLTTNRLVIFFRDQKGPKECISLTDLNRLSIEAQQVFKGSVDPDVVKFRNAISGVAKKNPPQAGSESVATKPQSSSSTDTPIGASAATTAEDTAPDDQAGLDTPTGTVSDTGGSPRPGTSTGEDDQTEAAQSPWLWVSIGLGILALALGGLAFWLNSEINTQKIRFDKKSRDDSFSLRQDLQTNFDKVSKEKIDRLTAENQKLNQTNDELLREINRLERQIGSGTPTSSTSVVHDMPPQLIPSAPEPPPAKAFFLSTPTPTSDGLCTFLDQRKAQFDPTSSLYRFELVNNNENQAQFRFESTSGTVSGALAYPDTYLYPACDYTGLDSKATRIDTTQPGRANRQGNVWKVTEKARIKFV